MSTDNGLMSTDNGRMSTDNGLMSTDKWLLSMDERLMYTDKQLMSMARRLLSMAKLLMYTDNWSVLAAGPKFDLAVAPKDENQVASRLEVVHYTRTKTVSNH